MFALCVRNMLLMLSATLRKMSHRRRLLRIFMIGVPNCADFRSRFSHSADAEPYTWTVCFVISNVLNKQYVFYLMQCITLVDYYVPLFFLQLESFQPHYFCKRMNLCGKVVALVEEVRQDSCGVCHRTVSEILIKLQDPDTQVSSNYKMMTLCLLSQVLFCHLCILCYRLIAL